MPDPTPRTFRIELDGRALGVCRVESAEDGQPLAEDLVRLSVPDGSVVDIPVSLSGALLQGLQSVTNPAERRIGLFRPGHLPKKAGQPWSEAEGEELKRRFLEGESVEALATHFQRTRGAIESRLVVLGVVEGLGPPRAARGAHPERSRA